MSTKDTGGPAYPGIEFIRNEAFPSQPIQKGVPGMTLRDYFAAKAMQGLLAQSCGSAMGSDPINGAQYAYAMADAMLEARKK